MLLYYEGKNITDFVDVTSCDHRDVSGGRADGITLTLEHADVWYAWGPRKGDALRVELDGYNTGVLYVDMILPQNGKFVITATSMTGAALKKAWGSFENTTVEGVMKACAAECWMGWEAFGVDTKAPVSFFIRKNEGCAAMLQRLLARESAMLKCLNGRLIAIGIPYAQGLPAITNLELDSQTQGMCYRKIEKRRLAAVNVLCARGSGRAQDTGAVNGIEETFTDLSVQNDVEAGKWAKGLLLMQNRTAEELELKTTFNPSISAMMRIDITGPIDAAGRWVVDDVRHDLKNQETRMRLYRCLESIV